MWDLPGPGLEPLSPALAGRFLATVPPGKPSYDILLIVFVDGGGVESILREMIFSLLRAKKWWVALFVFVALLVPNNLKLVMGLVS